MEQVLSGLRPFRYTDIEAYARFLGEAGGWPVGATPSPEELKVRWTRRARDPEATISLLREESQIVAHLVTALFDDRSRRMALELAVHPEWRRRGIGSALYALGIERAHEAAATHVSTPVLVSAAAENDEPVRFLVRRGHQYGTAYWQMRIDELSRQSAPKWPQGIAPRPFLEVPVAPERWAELITACFGEPATSTGIEAQTREPGSSPEGYVFAVDMVTGELIGTSRARLDPGADGVLGYVGTVGVLPRYRRRGIAEALVLDTLSYLRSRGASSAVLFVEDRNTGARALYERMGWYPVFRTEHYWRTLDPTREATS